MDKELVYNILNDILEAMEDRDYYHSRVLLEGFIEEIKNGIYVK